MNEYTGWNQPLMVTLTATTNEYLAPRLPLRGLLKVLETKTNGHTYGPHVSFRIVGDDGNPSGAWVQVPGAEFTYTLPR